MVRFCLLLFVSLRLLVIWCYGMFALFVVGGACWCCFGGFGFDVDFCVFLIWVGYYWFLNGSVGFRAYV